MSILATVAERVRFLRSERGWTQRELAERASLSQRFLAQVERGIGNISIERLAELASALGVRVTELLESSAPETRAPVVALLGVRGAGKSTIGEKLAKKLGVEFVELDAEIERNAGLSLAQVFELHGERYYRRVEREVLSQLLSREGGMVIATGGSLVNDRTTYNLLKRHATTIWLKASAEDHWNRVLEQGDDRPMAKNPHAMAELRALLAARQALYAEADHTVDTSKRTIPQAVSVIASSLSA